MSRERWFNEGGTVLDENRLPVAHVVNADDAPVIAASLALLDAVEALLAHEGERHVNGIGIEGDSRALEKAKHDAQAAIVAAKGPQP